MNWYDEIEAKALALHYGIKLTESAQHQFDSGSYLLKRRVYSNYDENNFLSRNVPQEIVFPESKMVATAILKNHTPLTIDFQDNRFILLNDQNPLYRKEVDFSKKPCFYGKKISNGDIVEQYITKLFGHSLGLFVNTGCFFAEIGQPCKFCSIKANQGRPRDIHSLANISDILESISIALREDSDINCIFISGGVASDNFDDNFITYSDIAIALRNYLDRNGYEKIEITLNTYPPKTLDLVQYIKEKHIAVMLSIESIDDTLRRKICPGKAYLFNKHGIDDLFAKFVDSVGYGRVLAFVIEGIETSNNIKYGVKKYGEMGVSIVVHVLHVDPGTWIHEQRFSPPPCDEIIRLASYTSQIYQKNHLNTSVLYGGRSSLDAESSIFALQEE